MLKENLIRKLKKIKLINVALTGIPMNEEAKITNTFIKSIQQIPEMKPFAGYSNFDDCVRKNQDKSDPEGYCATIMRRVEGKEDSMVTEEKAKYPWDQCIADQMRKYGSREKAEKICGAIRAGTVKKSSVDEYPKLKEIIEGDMMTEEKSNDKPEVKEEKTDFTKEIEELKSMVKSLSEKIEKIEKKEEEESKEEEKPEEKPEEKSKIEEIESEVKEIKKLVEKPVLKAISENVDYNKDDEPEEKSLLKTI